MSVRRGADDVQADELPRNGQRDAPAVIHVEMVAICAEVNGGAGSSSIRAGMCEPSHGVVCVTF